MNDMQKTIINEHVYKHHRYVEKVYPCHQVIFTALIGSQNYQLDSDKSDFDTVSFVLPGFFNFISEQSDCASKELKCEDGNCVVKDIRHLFHLVKKTTPNSIEYIATKYKYINPLYQDIINLYLENPDILYYLTHCNYNHMLSAISGMSFQLMRIDNIGKNFSHQLRLLELYKNFINRNEYNLFNWDSSNLMAARAAKFNPTSNTDYYAAEIKYIAKRLQELKEEFMTKHYDEKIQVIEQLGQTHADHLLLDIINKYLELNGYHNEGA